MHYNILLVSELFTRYTCKQKLKHKLNSLLQIELKKRLSQIYFQTKTRIVQQRVFIQQLLH